MTWDLTYNCPKITDAIFGNLWTEFELWWPAVLELQVLLYHLDEWEAERSPHESIDDGIDAWVDIAQSAEEIKNHHGVLDIAVWQYYVIHLEWRPANCEGRGNGHAHPGDFASCLLTGRRASWRSTTALSSNLNSKFNCDLTNLSTAEPQQS